MTEFKANNLDVWVDWEDIPPAVGWLDQILQGIEQAEVFVFLVSPDSIASDVCMAEVNHAYKNSKRIIPIVVRDSDPKSTIDIIRNLNWIFLREQDDFAAGLERIKVAINLDLPWLQEHRRLQVRALEWDRRKDPSLLLRGGDLRNARRMVLASEKKDPIPSELQKVYIFHSNRSERFRLITWVTAALAVLIMVVLSLIALDQRQKALVNEQRAVENAIEAQKQEKLAKEQEKLARENARAALAQKAIALENEIIAEAQRSAARAQIFQSKTGGLFTSSLLAIDSWFRKPNDEAEEVLRTNISLLPDPIKQIDQGSEITAIEVSPDGLTFASGSEDGKICLNRFQDGEVLFCMNSSGAVQDAVFNPAGDLLAVADIDGGVMILNASSGEILKQLNYNVPVWDLNISPNGRSLAIARDDGRIVFINLSTYQFESQFSVYGSLRVTAFSPDGEWFAAGSNLGALTFWNLADGDIISGGVHRGTVFDIAFSPDSESLLSGGEDNLAIVTQVRSGEKFLQIINEDWVKDVDFSPDGAWFVTASDDYRIRLWDTQTGNERLRILQDSLINELKVSPDGQWIAATGQDQTVRVWSVADGSEVYQVPLGSEGKLLDFSLDGSHLVVGDTDGIVSIWSLSALKTSIGYLQFDGFVTNLEISPTGDWIAASADDQVWLLDPNIYTTQTELPDNPDLEFKDDLVNDLAFSSDGKQLAVTTENGEVIIYDLTAKIERTQVQDGAAQKVVFAPDNASLILGSEDGVVQLQKVDSTEAIVLLDSDTPIYSLAISPNNLLAVGGFDKVWVIDLNSQQIISELVATDSNDTLAFDPDGGMLVSNTSAGYSYIWENEGGQFKKLVSIASEPALAMAFNSTNDRLYAGEDGQVVIFDPHTGAEAYRIRQKGNVTGIVFTPDWKVMITASLRTVRFFDISTLTGISKEALPEIACGRLTQNFSEAEWVSFFEGEPYRKLCEQLPVP